MGAQTMQQNKLKRTLSLALIPFFSLFSSLSSLASEAPLVGKAAAAKFLRNRPADSESRYSYQDHLLALNLGSFSSSSAYAWKYARRQDKVGQLTYGITYRMFQWQDSMDVHLRIDFNEYKIEQEKALKMSLMPIVMFPDADAHFPLYFGGGVGLGTYFKQIPDESNLSLDYQLLMGVRFENIYEGAGFLIEGGLKNHLHLLTDGQFNGTYLAGGMVFVF